MPRRPRFLAAAELAHSDVFHRLQRSERLGPAYNRLYEYKSWQDKTLIPALTGHTMSDDGKHWVINCARG
jgi:hypothetical protein